MKKVLWLLLSAMTLNAHAQVFWTETFSNSCAAGCFAYSYVGPNGTWTVTSTGANSSSSNKWFVSGAECGNAAGQCGTTCGSTDASLHIGSDIIIAIDPGAAYYAGIASNWRAESPVINCSGKSNITVSFNYIMEGQPGADFAGIAYFDGTTWYYYNGSAWTTTFTSLPVTNNISCSPQGLWTAYSVMLPASANNNPNVKIGFRWVNDNDGLGTDPSFAVDDINISSSAPGCSVNINPIFPAILCYGDCNSALVANGSGAPSLTYQWNTIPVQNTSTATGLCAGTYTVTLTDGNGCTATASMTITQPPQLTIDSIILSDYNGWNVTCFGSCDGSATPVVSGGTPPYLITQQINLCAGVYTATITDGNGCTATASFVITEPPLLTVSISDLDFNGWDQPCNGGCFDSLFANVSGGTAGYAYLWSNGCATQSCPNICAGAYSVIVSDANGCTAADTVSVTEPPPLVVSISDLDFNGWDEPCNGDCLDTLIATALGGSPLYSYLWSNGCTTSVCPNVCAGIYTITVADANGCTATDSFVVTEPPLLTMGSPVVTNTSCNGCSDGSICLGPHSGGTPSYTYSLIPNAGNFNGNCWQNLPAGIYTVCITDANGCTICVTDTLSDPLGIADIFTQEKIILSPNIISTSAVLTVPFTEAEFLFVIYDCYGKKIRDKIFNGKQVIVERENLSPGLYFFELRGNHRKYYTGKFMVE